MYMNVLCKLFQINQNVQSEVKAMAVIRQKTRGVLQTCIM